MNLVSGFTFRRQAGIGVLMAGAIAVFMLAGLSFGHVGNVPLTLDKPVVYLTALTVGPWAGLIAGAVSTGLTDLYTIMKIKVEVEDPEVRSVLVDLRRDVLLFALADVPIKGVAGWLAGWIVLRILRRPIPIDGGRLLGANLAGCACASIWTVVALAIVMPLLGFVALVQTSFATVVTPPVALAVQRVLSMREWKRLTRKPLSLVRNDHSDVKAQGVSGMRFSGLRGVALFVVAIAITWRVFNPVADCYGVEGQPLGTSAGGASDCSAHFGSHLARPNVPLTILHLAFLVALGAVVWYAPRLFPPKLEWLEFKIRRVNNIWQAQFDRGLIVKTMEYETLDAFSKDLEELVIKRTPKKFEP